VICGNHNEFQNFINKKTKELCNQGESISLSNFVYVSGVDRIRGISSMRGWFYGSWKDRPDIEQILLVLSNVFSNDLKKHENILNIWKEYKRS
jgi:hypothetical protein